MTPEQENLFKEELQKELQNAIIRGMSNGMKTVSKVFYDKIVNVNEETTREELLNIINELKRFCKTGLGIKE